MAAPRVTIIVPRCKVKGKLSIYIAPYILVVHQIKGALPSHNVVLIYLPLKDGRLSRPTGTRTDDHLITSRTRSHLRYPGKSNTTCYQHKYISFPILQY